jgi:hypothetical protein
VFGCIEGHVEEEDTYLCENCAWEIIQLIEHPVPGRLSCRVCWEWIDEYLCESMSMSMMQKIAEL